MKYHNENNRTNIQRKDATTKASRSYNDVFSRKFAQQRDFNMIVDNANRTKRKPTVGKAKFREDMERLLNQPPQ